jgi:hypothetical protein
MIPAGELNTKVGEMIELLQKKPSCVLRKVVDDPFMLSRES